MGRKNISVDYLVWLSSEEPHGTPFYVETAFPVIVGKVTDIDKEVMINALNCYDAEMKREHNAEPVDIYRLSIDGSSDSLKDEYAILLDDYCVAWELDGTMVGQKHYAVKVSG